MVDDDWNNFINDKHIISDNIKHIPTIIPKCGKLNISTKTVILFFNIKINLEKIFWNLSMINYDTFQEGIIKKQMKFNFNNKNKVNNFENKIKDIKHYKDIVILNQIDNPSGRIIFKDVRKVTIGFSKNDLIKNKKKSKSAFYNCLVLIYRYLYDNEFKELHIKIFNSGKIEIPGIKHDSLLDISSQIIIKLLQPFYNENIIEFKHKRETILINSNFTCNYFINRNNLYNIIKKNIKCNYDSCSYPGIQCKYKLNNNKYISYMIFRTGSILIVGKCEHPEIIEIYEYIKKLLNDNFQYIYESDTLYKENKEKKKIKKILYIRKI